MYIVYNLCVIRSYTFFAEIFQTVFEPSLCSENLQLYSEVNNGYDNEVATSQGMLLI